MWDWIGKLDELRKQPWTFAIVTVCASSGSTSREPGAKMLVLADGSFFGTIGGGYVEKTCLSDVKAAIEKGMSALKTYHLDASTDQLCGGSMEVFIEIMNSGPRLYLFGAGHVGKALCQVLDGTPFQVHLIDDRAEWIDASDLPKTVVRHSEGWKKFVDVAEWDSDKVYCVVMTYQHQLDFQILSGIAKRPCRYIGVIGSRNKSAAFHRQLEHKIAGAELQRIKCPLGLDIGGKAPKEIAVSVAAELLSILYGKHPDTVRPP